MIKNLRKNKKGFTLVEIIVVVVILAVLMAVAVPSVMKYVNEADNAKYMAQARGAMIVAQTESAKAWIDDKDALKDNEGNYKWTSTDTADILSSLQTKPKVKAVVADIDANGTVTKVVVTFDDNKTAEITPNGSVVIGN